MPYIKEEWRNKLGVDIDNLVVGIISQFPLEDREGVVNYVLTTIAMNALKPGQGWGYKTLSRVIGTLECAKLEVYRRALAPYEDGAISKNGDIPEYEPLSKHERVNASPA